MHIHGNPMSVQAANFFSAQLEQEVAARRVADLRRRLRRVSEAIATGSDQSPEETLLISHWVSGDAPSAAASPFLDGDEYRPSGQKIGEPEPNV